LVDGGGLGVQANHIVRRVQDALDLRCEGLECVALSPLNPCRS
jgi:hypothetical protein